MKNIKVGTIVRMKLPCLGNRIGDLGICIGTYKGGAYILLPNGSYDGFGNRPDSDEIENYTEIIGQIEINYKFTNAIDLHDRFKKGEFYKYFLEANSLFNNA